MLATIITTGGSHAEQQWWLLVRAAPASWNSWCTVAPETPKRPGLTDAIAILKKGDHRVGRSGYRQEELGDSSQRSRARTSLKLAKWRIHLWSYVGTSIVHRAGVHPCSQPADCYDEL
jgi:hypothetical protein